MTAVDAKDYAMTNLPCTTSAVLQLFKMDVGQHVRLIKMVGMRPKRLGYRTLVFYFQHPNYTPASEIPVRRYLLWWFQDKLNGKVGPYTNPGEEQVWWVQVPVEIKEDRAGV